MVSELHDRFERAKGVVFTDYRGLNVVEMSELRNLLRSAELEYKVVKNTLARIAAEGTSLDIARETLSGPIGIAVGYDDPVLLVKKVLEFNRGNDKLEIKGGVIEGSLCSSDEIKAISKLPSREVQLSMLVGAMQAPSRKLAGLMNATLTQFAYALGALKTKKEAGE